MGLSSQHQGLTIEAVIIDLEGLSEQLYSKDFSNWLLKTFSGSEFLIRFAQETSVVLLPGKGFDV